MKRLILSASMIILGFMATNAQSMKKNLEVVNKDPKTTERAAKADVYIAKNKSICDTSSNSKTERTKSSATIKEPRRKNSK